MALSFNRPACASSTSEDGFGLLEGLVAIALLAGTLAAIFALVGSVLDSASRVGRANQSSQMTLNAIEVMTAVNPMLQESGKIDVGPYAVSWTSSTITPPIDRAGSIYRIALYECDVRVEDPSGSILTHLKLRHIGYKRIGDPRGILGTDIPGGGFPAR
jgi:hypothetical protein